MSVFESAAWIAPTLLKDMRVATYRPRNDQPTEPPSIPLAINFIHKYHGGVGFAINQKAEPVVPWVENSEQERIHEMLGATEQLRGDKYNFQKRTHKPTMPTTPLSGNGAPSFPTATRSGAKKIKSLLNDRAQQYESLRLQVPLPPPSAPPLDESEAGKFELNLVIRSALDKITYGTVDKALYGEIIEIIRLFFGVATSMTSDEVVQFVSEMNDIAQTARLIMDDTANSRANRRLAKSILKITHTAALLAAEYGYRYADLPDIKQRQFGLNSLKKKVKYNTIALDPANATSLDPGNVHTAFLQNRVQPAPGAAFIQADPPVVTAVVRIDDALREQMRNSGFTEEEIDNMTDDDIADFRRLMAVGGEGKPRRKRR